MRILIATPLTPKQVGGPAQYAYQLERVFMQMGYEVASVAFTGVAKYPPIIRHIFLFFIVFCKVRKVDAVIVLDTVSMALPVVCATAILRVPVLVRVGGDFLWEQYVERTHTKVLLSEFYISKPKFSIKERFVFWLQKNVVLRFATKIIFSTRWQYEIWKQPYALQSHKIKIIENAYKRPELDYVDSTSSREPYEIVWIGRDLILKNVDILREAVSQIQKEYPQVRLVLLESLSHEETLKVLRSSWLVAIPSLSEVSPNLAIESVSLGTPVLLTRDCGLREVLDGVVAWIDSRDVSAVVRALRELMDTESYTALCKRMHNFNTTRTYESVGEEYIQQLRMLWNQ